MSERARTILRDHCGHLEAEGFILRAMEVYALEVAGQKPCLFFSAPDISEGIHEQSGYLSFDNARRGTFQMWGVVEGNTVAIVVEEDGGQAHAVGVQYVKFR